MSKTVPLLGKADPGFPSLTGHVFMPVEDAAGKGGWPLILMVT
jgi:hypothetical protein